MTAESTEMAAGVLTSEPQPARKAPAFHAMFDALNNGAVYSREPLQRYWNNTVEQLKE
jgi:hypothetical protein